jgi:hypothetical protein
VVLVDSYFLLDSQCAIEVDLDWQTPPMERILEALSIATARPYLETLGVTEKERHHLLSFDILEAFGVRIFPIDYEPLVERVRPLVEAVVRGQVAQLVAQLMATCESFNRANGDA